MTTPTAAHKSSRASGEIPRVGLIVSGYGIWSSPSLLNGVRLLAAHGYAVDVFTDIDEPAELVGIRNLPIEIHSTVAATRDHGGAATGGVTRRSWHRRIRDVLPRRAQQVLVGLWMAGPRLLALRRHASAGMEGKRYACLIGAETTGLAAAAMLGKRRRIPVVYWCLELWLWREVRSLYYRALKFLEFIFHRRAAFTIIPSADWIAPLAADNRVRPPSFVVVPATVRGPAFSRPSQYLRRRFGIGEHERIVLYAGSLVPWALVRELAEASRAWPDEWVLVLHGWGDERYIDSVRRAAPASRVRISTDVVPLDDLDPLVASADVGVALYEGDIAARRLITSASSKLGQYLKCGVPVVTNDFPGFHRLFSEYRAGVGVSSPATAGTAIETILADHARFRAEAFRCFEERYDFDLHFDAVLARLAALAPRPAVCPRTGPEL